MAEFWNSLLTERSWEILQDLQKKYNFILIGGWAVYLFTRQKKSKDIDIVISLEELQKFNSKNLSKNERLKKYEIKNEIDVDIYVEHYSKLVIPVEDMKKYSIKTQGFKVVCPELLLILKQEFYENRKNSIKGQKDEIDIVSLIFFSEMNFKKYRTILQKYHKQEYISNLISVLKTFKDYNTLNLTPRQLKINKSRFLNELKRL